MTPEAQEMLAAWKREHGAYAWQAEPRIGWAAWLIADASGPSCAAPTEHEACALLAKRMGIEPPKP